MGERPVVQRREPVSLEEWTKNIDSEGRILNVDNVKQMIFRGVNTLIWIIFEIAGIQVFLFLGEGGE